MALKVIFPVGTNDISVKGLYQWDYGQTLEIEASDIGTEVVEVHFACTNMTEAIVRSCSFVDGVGTVTVPDQCLEQSSNITAWIYKIKGTEGHTIKTITLPVVARIKPSKLHDIPPEIYDKYAELITEVNEMIDGLEKGNITAEKAQIADKANYATSAGNAASASHATKASNANNADKLKTVIINSTEDLMKLIADNTTDGASIPIAITSDNVELINNYGTAQAEYFYTIKKGSKGIMVRIGNDVSFYTVNTQATELTASYDISSKIWTAKSDHVNRADIADHANVATFLDDYGAPDSSRKIQVGYSGEGLTKCDYLAAYTGGVENGDPVKIKDIPVDRVSVGSATKASSITPYYVYEVSDLVNLVHDYQGRTFSLIFTENMTFEDKDGYIIAGADPDSSGIFTIANMVATLQIIDSNGYTNIVSYNDGEWVQGIINQSEYCNEALYADEAGHADSADEADEAHSARSLNSQYTRQPSSTIKHQGLYCIHCTVEDENFTAMMYLTSGKSQMYKDSHTGYELNFNGNDCKITVWKGSTVYATATLDIFLLMC